MAKIRERVFRNMKMKALIPCPLIQYRYVLMKDLEGLLACHESGSGLDKGFVKRLIRNKCHIMIIVF